MLPHCCFPVCSDVGVCYINLKVCYCCFPVCSDVGVYYESMLPHCCFPVCSDVGIYYINLRVCCLTVVSLYVVMWGYVTLI